MQDAFIQSHQLVELTRGQVVRLVSGGLATNVDVDMVNAFFALLYQHSKMRYRSSVGNEGRHLFFDVGTLPYSAKINEEDCIRWFRSTRIDVSCAKRLYFPVQNRSNTMLVVLDVEWRSVKVFNATGGSEQRLAEKAVILFRHLYRAKYPSQVRNRHLGVLF